MTGLGGARFSAWMLGSFGALVAVVVISPLFGAETTDVREAIDALFGGAASGPSFDILFLQRLPRTLVGAVAGGVLGVAGAAFQTALKNPLATPYTLGVASAGSLGAVVVMSLGLGASLGPFSSMQLGALAGAGLDVALVSALARRKSVDGSTGILLAGVTVSLISAAVVMLVRYLSSPHRIVEMDHWLMGGLDVVGYKPLASMLPFVCVGLAAVLMHVRALEQLSLGKAMAASRGVDVTAVERDIFIGGSLATAAVVSVTGPIGFVGLIVPHAVRRFAPRDHRVVVPVSFAVGGSFLILADTAARAAMAPSELPVGILTATVGGPIFLWILSRGKRRV